MTLENKIAKSKPVVFALMTAASFPFLAHDLIAADIQALLAPDAATFEEKKDSWSQLNHYSPAEGFHSKGSYGLHLGIGALAPESVPNTENVSKDDRGEMHQTRPRFYISKGTAWPVDFGASLSLIQGTKKAMQGGVHVQWTVFEGFSVPSVAFRASRSMLTNYQEVKRLTSDSLELGISYGLIRYVIVSAAVRQQWDKGDTQAEGDYLSLTAMELPSWTENRTVYSWGVNISPFTPFIQIGLEQSYWERHTQVSIAKISFLL